MTSDELTPDAFARLSALEQSQELLRRAQFLDASSRARHAEALDRQQAHLDRHEAMLARQQDLQQSLLHLLVAMRDRMDKTDSRIAQNEAMLQRLIDMQRHRNGH